MLFERAHDLLGQRFEGPGQHHAFLRVDRVLHQHQGADVLHVQGLGDLEILDLVKEVEDVDIGAVADGAEEGGDEKLAAAAAAVEINIEQVVVVELNLQPGAAVGNDAEGMEQLAIGMGHDLEGDAGRAVELGNDHPFRPVDDEGAALGHHRDLAHVDVLVLDEVLLPQPELDVERNGICNAFPNTLDLRVLGIAQGIGNVLQHQPLVIGLDGEDLAENRLQALRFALFLRNPLLQEVEVGRDLDFDQIRRLDDFT